VNAPLAVIPESPIELTHPSQSLAPFFQFGSRTAVQTATGTVAAAFVLEHYDKRLKLAAYSLRIMNSSHCVVVCRIWALDDGGYATLAYPLAIEVEPFSVKAADIAIYPNDYPSFGRAVAEVVGEGIHCAVEAAAPVYRKKHGIYPLLAAAGFATALLTASASAIFLSLPRISGFAAPPTATTGTTVDAEYTASGFGRLTYVVEAPDGTHTQEGVLADHTGSITIPIAASQQPGAYTLRLNMQGLFGTDRDVRVVNAVPPKVVSRSGARIMDISVNPAVAAPGQTVNVAYSAAGTDGYARLVGMDGTVWSQRPFSRSGATELVVPMIPTSREMRVVLHVTKGRSTAESSAGLLVNVGTQNTTTASQTSQSSADTTQADSTVQASGETNDPNANGTFSLSSNTVKSGGSIHVQIISPRNGMRISLMDTQSREISGVNVGSDAQSATLQAPNVNITTRYIVEVSFVDGFGQESIVEPVTVTP
jgi:hypothetical protein